MDVIDKIFELAREKYSEQKDFADAIQVNSAVVSRWANKKSQSYLKYMPQIADALDTTVADLFGANPVVLNDSAAQKLDPDKTIIMLEKDGEGRLIAVPIVQSISDTDARLLKWFRSLDPKKQKAILAAHDAPEDVE